MTETAMTKKSPCRCEGCGKKLTRRQRKIAKALGVDEVLCEGCVRKGKFPPAFDAVKRRFAETFRKLRDG